MSNSNSWCDMNDDFVETSNDNIETLEMPESASLINSYGIGKKTTSMSSIKSKQSSSDLSEIHQLSLSEILELNVESGEISEINILKNQAYIANQLKKYVSECSRSSKPFDNSLHLQKLKWLETSSSYMSAQRQQREIKPKKKHTMYRGSYEFCDNGHLCENNNNNKCNKKHFVYNLVNCDINELIRYLTHENAPAINEIFTSINTITFVFNHMRDEIESSN